MKTQLTRADGSASLAERQQQGPAYTMPCWGNPIPPGELITILLQREGTREDALETLAQTLADLGISGEEVAHWQKKPGICYDCNETDDRVRDQWLEKLAQFSTEPIEMYRGYNKADVKA